MSERNPMRQHPEWDVPAIAKALIGAEPVPEATPADTAGTTLPMGDASLTLFPEEQALEFKKQTIEHDIFLRLSAAGEVVFSFTPKPPVAGTPEPLQLTPVGSLAAEEPQGKPEPSAPRTPSGTPSEPVPEQEKNERVTITGRVGREPSFKNIKTGVMAKFPIAEHSDTDGSTKTTWHTIVSFGKTAEALRGTVAKGQMVTIAGYPHERTITNPKTGMEKIVTEIYLAGGLKHHK